MYVQKFKNDWKKILKRFQKKNKNLTLHFLKKRLMVLKGKPCIPREKFSHSEDLKICELFQKFGTDWIQISKSFPNRTSIMIKNRYYSYINKGSRYENLCKELKDPQEKEFDEFFFLETENPSSMVPNQLKLDYPERLEEFSERKCGRSGEKKVSFEDVLIMPMIQPPTNDQILHGDPKIPAIHNKYAEGTTDK
jgi:hypothetical protein